MLLPYKIIGRLIWRHDEEIARMQSAKKSIDVQMEIWQGKRNAHYHVLDIGWFGLAIPALGSFLSVYAIHLGASAFDLGLISSLPSLFMLFATFASGWWNQHFDNSIQAIQWPTLLSRARVLLLIALPLMPEAWRIPVFIINMALFAIPTGLANVSFLVLLRETISDDQLTSLVSRRQIVFNLSVAASTLGLGLWLEKVAFPLNYQVMFAFAFAAMMMSQLQLNRMQILYPRFEKAQTQKTTEDSPWRSPEFRRIAILIFALFASYFTLIPVIPLRLVNDLGASEGFISVYSFLELIGAATMAFFTSRVISRFGHRLVIIATMTITALGALILAGANTTLLTLPAAILAGGAWAATDITQYSFFSLAIRDAGKTSYSSAYFQTLSIAIFVGPMIGSTLANSGLDLSIVLVFGAALRLGAGLLTRRYRPVQGTPSNALPA
jgi:predicted MFS family arabinose efflux permease